MLAVLTLGAVQVAFVLYARNVLASAAHEGVRAAVERGHRRVPGPGLHLDRRLDAANITYTVQHRRRVAAIEAGVQAIFGPGTNLADAADEVLRLLGHNRPPLDEAAE